MHRVLAALVLCLASPAFSQSDAQLADRFDRAEAAAQYERALDAATKITERHPDSAPWAFNAGRLHARLGHTDDALANLRRAADLGYTGISSFEQHADLDPIRDNPEFRSILAAVRDNAAKRMAAFQAEAEQHVPPMFVPAGLPDGARPPLVVALHGTGGTGQQMLDALRDTCRRLGAVCIAPDALRPAAIGYAWTYRDESEWLVNRVIDDAIANHHADPDRVILLGFSQGANIALVMARTQPGRFRAIIPICGHYEPDNTNTDTKPAPMYLLTGARDDWKNTYTKARADLDAAGVPNTLRIVPNMGHQLAPPAELDRALRWALSDDLTRDRDKP